MVDIAAGNPQLPVILVDYRLARQLLLLLISIGLMSLAAASDREDRERCHAFIVGLSLIGSCDWLGSDDVAPVKTGSRVGAMLRSLRPE